ncbi:hypothetical protein RLW55_16900 [Hyphomicrobium sp. B1]|uniref:hypothetical protein n=1 Tax=Hyphomicrobium sp. B1 TaxID=3075651 RepID=UPI003C2B645E
MAKQMRKLNDWKKCIPAPTGDYSKDCDAGLKCAAEVISLVRRENAPWLIGWVVGEMNKRGLSAGIGGHGILAGFCSALGRRLIDGILVVDVREVA